MDNVYIKGVGIIPYGVYYKPSHMLAYDAVYNALEDANMSIEDIDAVIATTIEFFYSSERQRHFPAMLSSTLKIRKPIIRTPAACGGGGAALWTACKFLQNDENFNNILVVGAEKLFETTKNTEATTDEFMMAAENRWEQPEGLNFPSQNALIAQEYLRKYPHTTMDDLALIALKNHENAFFNPSAYFYKKKVTLEQIKNSPIVASPFRLFDCSISVDGSAACIVSKEKTDVKIAGSALYTDFLPPFERDNVTAWDGTLLSSKEAYNQAGIDPSDIDIAELHDAFTIVELIAYEDLGFAKKGEGYKLIRDGIVNKDGKLPINVSGGLKAKGHPVSATGIGMIYELVKQLRSQSGEQRQVDGVKTALAHNIGGAGGTAITHILKKV